MECLGAYKSTIYRHAVLCETAQLTHARRVDRWQRPSPEDVEAPDFHLIEKNGRRSLDTLVRTNLRLVVKIAQSYASFRSNGDGSLSVNDLIQEGNIGLVHGIKKYDPTKGYRISTYVTWWIRQSIQVALRKQSYFIRLPEQKQEDMAKIHKVLDSQNGRVMSTSKLAELTGFEEEKVRSLLMWSNERKVLSLDIIIDPKGTFTKATNDSSMLDFIEAPPPVEEEEEFEPTKEHLQLIEILDKLPPREALILRGFFYEAKTSKELGSELGLSPSRVMQIKVIALDKLKTLMAFHRADEE